MAELSKMTIEDKNRENIINEIIEDNEIIEESDAEFEENNANFANHVDSGEAYEARKMRILCVDDATFMLKTLESVLKDTYEVYCLPKATLVKNFLNNTTPDLFILDYNMPDLTGFELVPIIRSFPEHKETPIIFLTAMGTSAHVKNAVSLGACDYAVKPVKYELLKEKIAKHIKRKA